MCHACDDHATFPHHLTGTDTARRRSRTPVTAAVSIVVVRPHPPLLHRAHGVDRIDGTLTIDESLALSDCGTAVSVTAPPAGEVESFQQLVQAAGSSGTTPS